MDGGHQLLVVLDDEHYELLVHRAEGLGVGPEELAAKLIAEALDGSIA